MFKNTLFAASVIAISALALPSTAEARPKYWWGEWSQKHWDNLNFEQPYYEPTKLPHNSQWDYDDWKSKDWLNAKGSQAKLINGFYNADIIREQYIDDGVPVLVIGPNFFKLGGHDKRRVAQTIDEVFNVTGGSVFGSYMIYDWQSRKQIGIYTQQGLQLQ